MSRLTVDKIVGEMDALHRELALLSVDRRMGTPSALTTSDVLDSHSVLLRPKTWDFLTKSVQNAEGEQDAERMQRLLYGCMDLAVEEQVASLADMLNFYMERGRMHVDADRIPALEVVPWLQTEPDFGRREQMRRECAIFFKGIINPMMLGMLELTVRTVTEKFSFANYAEFCAAKKQLSFDEHATRYEAYLDTTQEVYESLMRPWVEHTIGRPWNDLSRFHALYLLRIRDFDQHFPVSRLRETVAHTFLGLDWDLFSRSDVIVDISDHPSRNPDGICVAVNVPGRVHVLVKPVGGLIDVETLLHETGHAFFLSHFDRELPMEFRRLYRSAALDECFAFLFMELTDNPAWLTTVAGMPGAAAEQLARISRTRRLCLIRRYIGKFLAEKELHEHAGIKDSGPYTRRLGEATGFTYEPQGYLVDMEPDFYSLDYLKAWAGANVLRQFLETHFGIGWFASKAAGDLLKDIASRGRRYSMDQAIISSCGVHPELPDFSMN